MLDVIARSQRGRICKYSKGEKCIVTPYVMKNVEGECSDPVYISTDENGRTLHFMGDILNLDTKVMNTESSGYEVPIHSYNKISIVRLPLSEKEVFPSETEVVVICNAFELKKDARKIVKTVIDIRNKVGYNVLILMLGIVDASTLALYSYMGVDVFDDSMARATGINGILSIPEGKIISENDMTDKNLLALNIECSKVHDFILGGRLRELVDQRAPSSPLSVAVLRIFDDDGYVYQEDGCSTVGCKFSCNTLQSLKRPEVLRYRKMIMERYKKPKHKRVLLLLPCSAKKPYHLSKTHKRLSSAIHTANHDALVHEVIITSPLGIVPRELDIFFPPKSYDIPVTGQWMLEEKQFIREMLTHFIEQGYDRVISHLGKDAELIEGLCEMTDTVLEDPLSSASLKNLDETLREATKGMNSVDYSIDRKETVRSVMNFQFGAEIADAVMDDDTFCVGKFPYWKIMRNEIQLGMLTEERGMISMTIDGAKILAEHNYHVVEMTDFKLSGSLFAIGVKNADPSIRIGDEAVVTFNGEVKAIGVAMMSGKEMKDLNRGIAVRIRHRIK